MSSSIFSSAVASTAESVKSYNKMEKNFTMTPRFLVTSPTSPSATVHVPIAAAADDKAGGLKPPRSEGFDPNARSLSIGVQHRTPIGETLVTVLPKRRPSGWPDEFKDESEFDPDEDAKQRRRRIETTLRMYPRNTWGPTNKWGWLDDVPEAGNFSEKEHFKDSNAICNHDKLEKERIQKRDTEFVRNWTKYQDPVHLWEGNWEARQSLAYGEPQDQYTRNTEKMLHAQNDKRLAQIKREDARVRSIKNTKEFTRLERREVEFVKRTENEAERRKFPGARKIKSSVNYDILAPDFKPMEEVYYTKLKKWRAMMRALRIQSKQSGARMYDVISWKPQKPCRVPPPKPELSDEPEVVQPEVLHAERKPTPPRPRNMLHSLDKLEDVPIGPTQDFRTKW